VGQLITLTCDLCGSSDAVETMVCSRPGMRSFEFDVCAACLDRPPISNCRDVSRPSDKQAGRTQVRFRLTELPPQPRGDKSSDKSSNDAESRHRRGNSA